MPEIDWLVVFASGTLGGAQRLLCDVTPVLGGEVMVACPGAVADTVEAAGARVARIAERDLEALPTLRSRMTAAGRRVALTIEVARLMRRLRPRAVLAWSFDALLAAEPARHTIRPRSRLIFQHNDFLPASPLRALVLGAAGRADGVIAPSRACVEELGLDGAAAVHPGVDLERFAAAPLPREGITVLLLGAIVDWKRPDLALEIVARAARDLEGIRLIIAGAPVDSRGHELLESLRRRAAEPDLRGRVEFRGHQDPVDALGSATCLLHCADAEPFGLALVEAMARGRPVVAPAAGGPLEIVDDASGALYPAGDAEAGARALTDLLGDPDRLERLAEGARRRAESRFSLAAARERQASALKAFAGQSAAVCS